MVLEYVAAIVAILTVTLVLYLKNRFTYWSRRGVFTLPPSIPFGNAKHAFLRTSSISFDLRRLYKELKSRKLKYGGYYFSTKAFFIPVDLALIRNILVKDFPHFMDHSFLNVNESVDPLAGHLFAQRGGKWRALRNKLSPAFTSRKLKYMFQTLVDCTKGLSLVLDEVAEANQPIDIKDTFAKYTTDVVGSCAFGIECNCFKNPNTGFRAIGRRIFSTTPKTTMKIILGFLAPSLFNAFRIPVTEKEVENFIMDLVKETVEYRDKNKVERKDFMQLLLNLRHETLKADNINEAVDYCQNGLSLNEIAAQAFVFFAAGFETSSTTLTFLMYELTMHQEIQEKLRAEINEVLAKYEGKITYDAINEMMYLDKCIKETLRKYPAALSLLRECTKTYHAPDSDLVIEKGTTTLIPVYEIHHDAEYYPEPEEFNPERFSDVNKTGKHSYAYMPFGKGPRICIGLRFGVLQVKVGVVAMLNHYRFSIDPKTKIPLEFDKVQPILTADGEVWVNTQKI